MGVDVVAGCISQSKAAPSPGVLSTVKAVISGALFESSIYLCISTSYSPVSLLRHVQSTEYFLRRSIATGEAGWLPYHVLIILRLRDIRSTLTSDLLLGQNRDRGSLDVSCNG